MSSSSHSVLSNTLWLEIGQAGGRKGYRTTENGAPFLAVEVRGGFQAIKMNHEINTRHTYPS